jgi:hypothetical protein
MAIASMILGIVLLVFFCLWRLSLPAAILAIVLGFMAKSRLLPGQAGRGMATAGIIALFLCVVIIAGVLSLLHFGLPFLQKAQQQMQQQLQQQQQLPKTTTTPAALLHSPRLMFGSVKQSFLLTNYS